MDLFENFCRTCGNACEEALNIFNENSAAPWPGINESLLSVLAKCLPASLPSIERDDDYPKQICRICLKKLLLMYEFVKKWEETHYEFNVALKFQPRRKRNPISSVTSTNANQSKKKSPATATEAVKPAQPIDSAPVSPPIQPKQERTSARPTQTVVEIPYEYSVQAMDETGQASNENVVINENVDETKGTFLFKIEPNGEINNEFTMLNEENNDFSVPMPMVEIPSESIMNIVMSQLPQTSDLPDKTFNCIFCPESYHTMKAFELHLKFAHRDVEYIFNT
ncbi:uncharacterized protein LOC115633298 [Scaptodrosophila lebanonensis]|uniref:Uncharacterized protein LOC115633298 n=1 Tax=Drosophila lebanonensis TaxID=7225 RepID=A0A6J2UDX7_DROLE|nr:uncharacterized protein LOC115633298 [Scaptodrosophila lebanonensis]